MKKYIAKPLEEQLEEVKGTATEFRAKFTDIYYIYSKPCTPLNIKKYIQPPTKEKDYEAFKDEDGSGVMFYWQTPPLMTKPQTIGQFISIATALGQQLYWDEDTYRDYIYVNESR